MHRVVNILAMLALVVTLGAGLWQDWGLFTTLKRMIFAYLGFFFLGGILTLAVLAVPIFDKESNDEPETETRKNKTAA